MSRIPSFHLTIQFVGECLFVPDPGAKTMHVLMPYVTPTDNVPEHVVAVCVEGRFIGPDAPEWTSVTMDRVVLSVPAGGNPLSYDLPSGPDGGLAPVGAVAKASINTETLGDDPSQLLSGRMDLQYGSYGKDVPGGCWDYPNNDTRSRITYQLNWDVGTLPGDSLDLGQTVLSGGSVATLPTLVPDENGTIEVLVCHVPASELPPPFTIPQAPKRGSSAGHFAAFYNVFVNPADTTLPRFFGMSCSMGEGGNPYTCMGAQSPLTPG